MKFGAVAPNDARGATAVHTIRQGSLVLKKRVTASAGCLSRKQRRAATSGSSARRGDGADRPVGGGGPAPSAGGGPAPGAGFLSVAATSWIDGKSATVSVGRTGGGGGG